MKTKSRAKLIMTSLIAIICCITLIAGATFALFTSESKVNIAVTSGKVDVKASVSVSKLYSLEYKENGPIEDEFGNTYIQKEVSEKWTNQGTATVLDDGTLALTNMTAGDKVDFNLLIKNNSNVAIKYRVKAQLVSGEELGKELVYTVDGIKWSGVKSFTSEWKVFGDDVEAPISIELPATSKLQDKASSIVITVEAIQGNAKTVDAREIERFAVSSVTAQEQKAVPVTADGDGKFDAGETTMEIIVKDNEEVLAGTKATFEAGWFKSETSEDINAVLTVETFDAASAEDKADFTIETAQTFVSAIDVNMFVNESKVSEFNGTKATIATFVGKNLVDPKLYYQGQEVTADTLDSLGCKLISYDKITGIMTFETLHFSEWYVTSKVMKWSALAADNFSDIDNTNKVITITSAEELALFGNNVNGGNNYRNWTIKLGNDIDLLGYANYIWAPIGSANEYNENGYFAGVFDGQNHTIYNMKTCEGGTYGNGLFGKIQQVGTVKNLTLDGAYVSNEVDGKGNVYGIVCGYAYYGTFTFENVHVKNSKINAFGKVGGLVGMTEDMDTKLTLINCSVEDTVIAGAYNCAGLVGLVQGSIEITNCTVKNVVWEKAYPDNQYITFNNVVTKSGKQNVSGIYWDYDGYNLYSAYSDLYNDYYNWVDWGLENKGKEPKYFGYTEFEYGNKTYDFDGYCHNN